MREGIGGKSKTVDLRSQLQGPVGSSENMGITVTATPIPKRKKSWIFTYPTNNSVSKPDISVIRNNVNPEYNNHER